MIFISFFKIVFTYVLFAIINETSIVNETFVLVVNETFVSVVNEVLVSIVDKTLVLNTNVIDISTKSFLSVMNYEDINDNI